MLRCSCGAVLPEDARFCHKCGKPQYEEDIERLVQAAPAQRSVEPVRSWDAEPKTARIDFRNGRAVAISLCLAVLALLGMVLISTVVPTLIPLLFCAAGYAAAVIYNRGTTQKLTAFNGARLGWMTGLWAFLAIAMLLTALVGLVSNPTIRAQLLRFPVPANNPNAKEFFQMMAQPRQFAIDAMLSLVPVFVWVTLVAALGGLLGAKISPGQRRL